MARESRKESPTKYYHVMMRGNNKEMIFENEAEKQYFLDQLQFQSNEGNIIIVAYCIMDNHVHLLINADILTMSESLKWINIKFASKYNYKYERVGHVFQGRYKSEIINNENHLVQVLRYIHNNPVSAKMVPQVSEYKWSSYNHYLYEKDNIIDPYEKQLILEIFSKSTKQFQEFHLKEETNEFLEISIDLEKQKEEKAEKIITKYLDIHNIKNYDELRDNKKILEELVIELINTSKLSHRRISELLGLNRGRIHSIAKKQ